MILAVSISSISTCTILAGRHKADRHTPLPFSSSSPYLLYPPFVQIEIKLSFLCTRSLRSVPTNRAHKTHSYSAKGVISNHRATDGYAVLVMAFHHHVHLAGISDRRNVTQKRLAYTANVNSESYIYIYIHIFLLFFSQHARFTAVE